MLLLTTSILLASLLLPAATLAYSPSAAAAYADSHWNSCGVSGQYPCVPNDCTNFSSQVIFAGGVDMVGLNNPNSGDPHKWYAWPGPQGTWQITTTWKFAESLYDFLVWDVPGGTLKKTWTPATGQPGDSQGVTGDLVFYDWQPNIPDGGSEPRDHVNPIVGSGYSDDDEPGTHDPYFGDYVDGHTSNRHHYFWALKSVNQFRLTTVFYVMHILSTN